MELGAGRERFELVEGDAVGAAEGEFGHGRVGPVFEEGVGEVSEFGFAELGEALGNGAWGLGGRGARRSDVFSRIVVLGVRCLCVRCLYSCCDHAVIVADGSRRARAAGRSAMKQRTDVGMRGGMRTDGGSW